jgi:Protein of unknown function (DUF3987)
MRTHLEYVRPAARDNEFVDAPEAIGLHMLLTEALESWDDLDDEQGWYPAEAVATELRAAFVAATAERRTDSGARHRGPEAPRQPPTPCASTMTANGLEELRAAIEPHRRPAHGRYAGIADWINKLPDTIVRTAAAITLLHDPDAQEITNATLRDAVRVGRAGISHARAAFGLTRPDGRHSVKLDRCSPPSTGCASTPAPTASPAATCTRSSVTAHGWRPSKASTFRSSCSALVREVGLPPAALVAEVGDDCAESWRRGQTDQRLPARIRWPSPESVETSD